MTTYTRFGSHLELSQRDVSTRDSSHINFTFYAQNNLLLFHPLSSAPADVTRHNCSTVNISLLKLFLSACKWVSVFRRSVCSEGQCVQNVEPCPRGSTQRSSPCGSPTSRIFHPFTIFPWLSSEDWLPRVGENVGGFFPSPFRGLLKPGL